MSWIVQVAFVMPASGAGQELSHREGTERSIQLVGKTRTANAEGLESSTYGFGDRRSAS